MLNQTITPRQIRNLTDKIYAARRASRFDIKHRKIYIHRDKNKFTTMVGDKVPKGCWLPIVSIGPFGSVLFEDNSVAIALKEQIHANNF